jgi:hypothetical protein
MEIQENKNFKNCENLGQFFPEVEIGKIGTWFWQLMIRLCLQQTRSPEENSRNNYRIIKDVDILMVTI